MVERTTLVRSRRPVDRRKSNGEAESVNDGRRAPAEGLQARRLDHANVENVRTARSMLVRIVDLLSRPAPPSPGAVEH